MKLGAGKPICPQTGAEHSGEGGGDSEDQASVRRR